MGNEVRLQQDGNCFYLLQSLVGMSLYQRTKAIEKFIKHETKILENCIETEIKSIFTNNGINVYDTNESALNELFSALNSKGKRIEITDLFECKVDDNCVLLGKSPNKMTVWLEDETLLECGIRIREIEV